MAPRKEATDGGRSARNKLHRARRQRRTRTRSRRDESRGGRKDWSRGAPWNENLRRLASAKLVRIGPCDSCERPRLYGFGSDRSTGGFTWPKALSYHGAR